MTTAPVDPNSRAAEVRGLVTMMDEVLTRVKAAYAASGVELPSRAYWTLGSPAVDCEQVVVSFIQGYIGPPGDEASSPQRCNSPRSAALDIQVSRCVPGLGSRGRIPKATEIQAGSEQLAIDAWLLLDIAASLDSWDSFGGPGLGVIATIDVSEPSGEIQSVVLHLTAAIP